MGTAAHHLLRVERGHATPEELAALTAVLMARAAARLAAAAEEPTAERRPAGPVERLPAGPNGFRTRHGWDRPKS